MNAIRTSDLTIPARLALIVVPAVGLSLSLVLASPAYSSTFSTTMVHLVTSAAIAPIAAGCGTSTAPTNPKVKWYYVPRAARLRGTFVKP